MNKKVLIAIVIVIAAVVFLAAMILLDNSKTAKAKSLMAKTIVVSWCLSGKYDYDFNYNFGFGQASSVIVVSCYSDSGETSQRQTYDGDSGTLISTYDFTLSSDHPIVTCHQTCPELTHGERNVEICGQGMICYDEQCVYYNISCST
ncbi:hypothetical protein COT97_01250 [Candidatus Falkowbacteria bacterium CG10_big_fil_rev_8_21_14_0_10_39_11]|uniref:Transmembrane protein n=1 Tax=Candidatus Falkowbacteria bacterium CG10_big_fil_rev_8_21_14_0_10_39_11 TaxID=1974565 RepID=A0A2H0V5T2_9BACT|nr:MAG: hypothetical protein COT97_01250 [Candidatus Falkowbacteria bacterium CG10_big_fil_rev_8_21_14_0_10_39_11]